MTENELYENKNIKVTVYNGNDFFYMNNMCKFPFAYEVARKIDGEFKVYENAERIAKALKYCYENNMRCRIWYGDSETGESWLDEIDITGYVKRSGGCLKVPLLVYNSRSWGGGEILMNAIVRIDCIKTKEKLYVHKNFHVPSLVIVPSDTDGYEWQVENGTTGRVCARFKTRIQAERYIEFMKGERYSK
jgi:hypothetical protein